MGMVDSPFRPHKKSDAHYSSWLGPNEHWARREVGDGVLVYGAFLGVEITVVFILFLVFSFS